MSFLLSARKIALGEEPVSGSDSLELGLTMLWWDTK
jgi:hypothetical protein